MGEHLARAESVRSPPTWRDVREEELRRLRRWVRWGFTLMSVSPSLQRGSQAETDKKR